MPRGGRLAKKGLDYLGSKTAFLDEAAQLRGKEAVKNRIVEVPLGAYLTQEYEGLFPACAESPTRQSFGDGAASAGRRGRFDPQLGFGLSVSF